jgi:hypothetical protein
VRRSSRRRLSRTSLIAGIAGIVALLLAAGAFVAYQHRGGGTTSTGGTVSTGGTLYGASFQTDPGESYRAALARTDKTLGRLDLVRVFYPRAPAPWPGKAPGRNVVVSFKLSPRLVLAGRWDAAMTAWFAGAPKNLDVYWSYWHEPENDIQAGSFTAAEYKAAFQHLDDLAKQADNPRLRSTVILQSYTTRPASGRNWRDYVPDPSSVDVLAWDVYNRDKSQYSSPADLLGAPLQASESFGRPFAVAELGSALVAGDDGSGRAAWLRSLGAYLKLHDAVFVDYFDFLWNGGANDYRLSDKASLDAWKSISGG